MTDSAMQWVRKKLNRILCLSCLITRAPTEQKSEKALWEQRNMFVARIKILGSVRNRQFFLVSALLWDYSLCWDCVNGTWLLHLTRPCLLALGRVLIRVCRQVFLLLNDRYTILRQDSNPPKQSEDCYQSMPLPPRHHGWVIAQG